MSGLVAAHGFGGGYQRVTLYVAARRPVIVPGGEGDVQWEWWASLRSEGLASERSFRVRSDQQGLLWRKQLCQH